MKYPFRALSLPCLFAVCLFCMEAFVLPAFSRAQEHPFLRVEAGGHNASVRAVLFTPDGKRVISVGYDKAARIWDATGKRTEQLQTLRYHIGDGESGEITSAAISPRQDHPQLALGVKEDNISCVRVIDYISGQVLRTLRGDEDGGVVTALKFSSDGARLAVGTAFGTLYMWEGANAKPASKNRLFKAEVNADAAVAKFNYVTGLAFSPDDKQIAVAFHKTDNTGFVQQFSGGLVNQGMPHTSKVPIRGIDWAQATGTLAWGNDSGEIYLLDAQGQLTSLPGFRDSITCLTFSRDGKQLISAGGQFDRELRDIHVWSVEQRQELQKFSEHHAPVFAVALSNSDTPYAASADSTGHVYLWEPATGKAIAAFEGEGEALSKVYWDPTGHTLAWGGIEANSLVKYAFSLDKMLPAPTPPALPPLNNPVGWTTYAGTTQAGLTLLVDRRDGDTLNVMRKAAVVRSIKPGGRIESYTFTPNGDIVVGAGGRLALYSGKAEGGANKLLCKFEGHEGSIRSAAVSPVNADYLATASTDRTTRLWSLNPKDWTQDNNTKEFVSKPLISLFMADGGRWIAWTEAGYYYASPDGEELIGWHENRGLDRPAVFHNTNDFKARFRNRNALRLVFDKGNVQALAQLNQPGQNIPANTTILQEIQKTLHVGNVKLDAPAQKTDAGSLTWTTNQPQALARVSVEGIADVSQVEFKVSRHYSAKSLILEDDVPAEQRSLRLDLLPGENVFHIQARKKGVDTSYGESLVLHIQYAAEPIHPDLHALVIGVQQFTDAQIMAANVAYTVKDAQAIAGLCRENTKGVFAAIDVRKPLLDAEATPEHVLAAVKDVLSSAKKGDVVLLYMSSHGVRPPQDEQGRGKTPGLYFAMNQTQLDKKTFYETALSCDALLKTIDENVQDTVRVVLMLDTCYAAKLADAELYNDAISHLREHVFVLTSCDINEESMEDKGWEHGLFTGAFVDMFQPKSSAVPFLNANRELTLHDIAYIVGRSVHDRIEKNRNQFGSRGQHPKLYGPGDTYFPLFKIP